MEAEQTVAYNIMKDFGVAPERAVAFSRIFATEDTPENRLQLIQDMENAGFEHAAAQSLVDLFLERQKDA